MSGWTRVLLMLPSHSLILTNKFRVGQSVNGKQRSNRMPSAMSTPSRCRYIAMRSVWLRILSKVSKRLLKKINGTSLLTILGPTTRLRLFLEADMSSNIHTQNRQCLISRAWDWMWTVLPRFNSTILLAWTNQNKRSLTKIRLMSSIRVWTQ